LLIFIKNINQGSGLDFTRQKKYLKKIMILTYKKLLVKISKSSMKDLNLLKCFIYTLTHKVVILARMYMMWPRKQPKDSLIESRLTLDLWTLSEMSISYCSNMKYLLLCCMLMERRLDWPKRKKYRNYRKRLIKP
jgi:hypothetical protein